ncbi:RNA polymerase sigma factor [Bizionia sp.]|uniref:RNA polymerase sigma factor n=1 Tax=Bizionia sp. TaxID=1954480 RepID=UPI003A9258B6
MIEDQYLIDQLKQQDLKCLDNIYRTYKKEFFLFARKWALQEDDIADVYQDTIINLYENIQNGKLKKLSSSLKTYLFAIGKFQVYKRLNKNKPKPLEEMTIYASEELKIFEADSDNLKLQVLKKAFSKLGDKCKQVLELYYYEGLTLDEIQAFLKYSNKDVLKSQKSRCLKQLKELAKKIHE